VTDARRSSGMRRVAALAALSIGLGLGGYGIASAASGTASTSATAAATTAPPTPGATAAGSQGATPRGWGGQRSDETALTGDALAMVTAAAEGKVPDGTIVRVETDADGNAKYEAHMTKSDGSRVTVYVDASFDVVSVQTR
jgi:hypothetical protein